MTATIATAFPTTQFEAMPEISIEWAPTSAPNDAPVWAELSSRVRSFTTHRGRNNELEQYEAGTLNVVCDSKDRLLDPSYTGGPWAGKVKPNRQIRLRARYAGTIYDIIYAFIDGTPQLYEMTTTTVEVKATDGFKILAGVDLVDQFTDLMRTLQPTHWWRFDPTAEQFDALWWDAITDSGYGATLSTASDVNHVTTAAPIRLGSTGSLEFSSAPSGTLFGWGRVEFDTPNPFPTSTTAWSFCMWEQSNGGGTNASGDSMGLLTAGQTAYFNDTNTITMWHELDTDHEGRMYTSSTVGLVDSAGIDDDTVHFVVLTYSGPNTRLRLYVDGVLVDTDSTGIPATFTPTKNWFRVGVARSSSLTTDYQFYGSISDVQVFDGTELTAAQILAMYNAGSNGYSGESTGTRAGRVADQTAWPTARRTIATGDVNVGVHVLEGNALDYLQRVAATEQGELYMERDGTLMFRDRSALADDTRSNTSQATFGPLGGGDLDYYDVTTNPGDEAQIRNSITITRDGGAPQYVQSASSREEFGIHSYDESGSLDETDTTALAKANTILTRYAQPRLRVTSITIKPGANPALLFPQVLGRRIGDRITVIIDQDVGSDITQDAWIEAIDHDVTDDEWITVFGLVAVV